MVDAKKREGRRQCDGLGLIDGGRRDIRQGLEIGRGVGDIGFSGDGEARGGDGKSERKKGAEGSMVVLGFG